MKAVQKILEYQRIIERLLKDRAYDVFELENICLCRIGHIACNESFEHALDDLVANGRVKQIQSIITNNSV